MIRDTNTNAILSTDKAALDKYRMEKQRVVQIEQLRKDVAQLQDTVRNICKVIDKIVEEK